MMESNFSCALCLDFVSDNGDSDYFVSTECGHLFHYLCLKPSYDKGYKECPICRAPLTLDTLRKLFGIDAESSPSRKVSKDVSSSIEFDQKFKIIIVGESGVGKSCLLQRYVDDFFDGKLFSTVGCDWRTRTINIGGKVVSLSLWDTVGQERHRSLITNYARDAHGALIVFDISDRSSFDDIDYWCDFINDHGLKGCAKVLVGNKTDLEQHRQVAKSVAKDTAKKFGIPYFETSAKDAYNVEVTFRTLAANILENESLMKEIDAKSKNKTLKIEKTQQPTPGILESSCSYGWYWTKTGVRNSWRYIASSLKKS